jgi:Homeodomain-like domain
LRRLTAKAVREIGRRYEDRELEPTLYERPRPGAAPVLDASRKQHIIDMVCSGPSEDRARWTVRVMAEEAVKRRSVVQVGCETIRLLPLYHDLKHA